MRLSRFCENLRLSINPRTAKMQKSKPAQTKNPINKKEFHTAVFYGCVKAFLLTVSTAPQRTFVRLSERFPCLRVFLNVCSVSKNTFSTR
jgi:hypothetical protein